MSIVASSSESVSQTQSDILSESMFVSDLLSTSHKSSVSERYSESVLESMNESTGENLSENEGFPQSELASEFIPEPVSPQPPRTVQKQQLPNTGEESSIWTSLLGTVLLFGGLFKQRKKRNGDEPEE
ncbi:TPA: LPXTG cell wall anchor domain-containing protein [Streptococcus suis]